MILEPPKIKADTVSTVSPSISHEVMGPDVMIFLSVFFFWDFTPVRMSAIQKSASNKCWRGCGEKGTLLHCWWECKLVQPRRRTVWRFLKKLQIELQYDPAIPLLGIHTKETRIERDTCTNVHCSTVDNNQGMETT